MSMQRQPTPNQQQQQNDNTDEYNEASNLHDCYRRKISLLLHSISDVVVNTRSINTNSVSTDDSRGKTKDENKRNEKIMRLNDPMEWARSLSLRSLYNEEKKSEERFDGTTNSTMNDTFGAFSPLFNFGTVTNNVGNIENDATKRTSSDTTVAEKEKKTIIKAIRSLTNDASLMSTSSSSSSSFLHEDFICATCGTLLLPGSKNGTKICLRKRKRGRSRRRKCSRTKAAEHISNVKSQKVRSGNGKEWSSPIPTKTNNSQTSTITTAVENLTQQQKHTQTYKLLHQTKDGTSINSIVYICKYCGTRMEFKGLPASTKDKRDVATPKKKVQKQRYEGVDKMTERNKRKGRNVKDEAIISKKTKQNNGGTIAQQLEDGFIPLGGGGGSASIENEKIKPAEKTAFSQQMPTTPVPARKKTQLSTNNMPSITHLSQSTGKKKKKRKSLDDAENTKKSKSDLMNFLSSLND